MAQYLALPYWISSAICFFPVFNPDVALELRNETLNGKKYAFGSTSQRPDPEFVAVLWIQKKGGEASDFWR
jgi:hypothetical protein